MCARVAMHEDPPAFRSIRRRVKSSNNHRIWNCAGCPPKKNKHPQQSQSFKNPEFCLCYRCDVSVASLTMQFAYEHIRGLVRMRPL